MSSLPCKELSFNDTVTCKKQNKRERDKHNYECMDEWWMMNEEWRMKNEEWRMKNEEWRMKNEEQFTVRFKGTSGYAG